VKVPVEALTTKVVVELIVVKSKWQQNKTKKKDFFILGTPQLRSLINCINILKTQYNTSKAIMASINKNSQTTRNHYRGKTHVNNIIFSNMKILQHKP
jgi:hypothetical protein